MSLAKKQATKGKWLPVELIACAVRLFNLTVFHGVFWQDPRQPETL